MPMRRHAWLFLLLALLWNPATVAAAPKQSASVDPAFGETLYAFYQRQYFDALSRLLVARERGELKRQAAEAELLLGGLYVQYDVPDAAREIFSTLLPDAGSSLQARKIWLAIAELDYRRGRFPEALAIVERHFRRPVADMPAAELPPEQAMMLAVKSLMRMGRYAEAVAWLGPAGSATPESRYLAFNLAVALVGNDDAEAGAKMLQDLLLAPAVDEEMSAVRDRVALALAATRLQQQRPAEALAAIAMAQLDGPYSNEAMLVYGVSALRAGNPRGALRVLLPLSKRAPHEQAVQEGWVALAQAYDQAGDGRRAHAAYRAALAKLDGELAWLQEQQNGIAAGKWFEALERQARDIALRDDRQGLADRDVLGMPLHYRMFAGNRFVLTFAQYVEVSRLARVATDWQQRIPVLDYLVQNRLDRHRRESLRARELVAALPLAPQEARQRQLAAQVAAAIAGEDPRPLATPAQRRLLQLADAAEARMRAWPDRNWETQRGRLGLLRGALGWEMTRERPLREWELRRAVRDGERQLDEMRTLHARVGKAAGRQLASVDDWQRRLGEEDLKLRELAARSVGLRKALRQQLEQDAAATVAARRTRIIELAGDAWFGLAQIEHAAWRDRQRPAVPAAAAGAEETGAEKTGTEAGKPASP